MDSYIFYKLFFVFFLLILNSLFSGFWFFQRKQTLLVDAISHSVLPILVLVYLIVGSLNSTLYLFLAVLFSSLVVFVISSLSDFNTKRSQSIIGVFFSGFFALGLLLTNLFARNVHLDADSVLFGSLEFVVFENVTLFGLTMPIALIKLIMLLFVNVCVFYFFRHLFTFLSFDKLQLARKGFNVTFVDFLQVFLLVFNVIISFEIVGVILTLGLNTIPIMIGRMYSFNTAEIINISFIYSLLALFLSSFLSFSFNISLSAVFIIVLSFLFWLKLLFKRYLIKL